MQLYGLYVKALILFAIVGKWMLEHKIEIVIKAFYEGL